MAVRQDELDALYDQALARRGGSSSPALNKIPGFNPAITTQPAARNVTPAALAAKPAVQPVTPMTRVGRAGIQTPVVGGGSAGPRFQSGLPGSGGAGRGRTTLQTAPTPLSVVQDAKAKATTRTPTTTINPLNPLNGNTAIPSGSAAALPSSAPVLSAQEAPSGKMTREGNSYTQTPDSGTYTLADARRDTSGPGSSGYGLSVIGMGLSPEATLAKLKEQTAAVQGLNRNKSTGLSDAELAKVDARRATDSEIFQLTQQGHSLQDASSFVAKRDAALAKQTVVSPEQSALNQQALLKGGQGLQAGAMELEKGRSEAQTLQAKRAIAEQLGALDPKDTKKRSALIDELLAYDSKVQTPQKQHALQAVSEPVYDDTGVRTGTRSGAFDPNTGQRSYEAQAAPGGAQALPEGVTPDSMRANAVNAVKQNPAQLEALNERLKMYGVPLLTQADLTG